MNSKPSNLEDDVEVIALNQYEDGHIDQGEDDADDHDRAALLGSSSRTRGLERSTSKWLQVKGLVTEAAPTLLLTCVSLTFTGELLERVSRWRAMKELDQLIVMIPIVLNLNGNIEMNLSARLGTAANVGELDDSKTRRPMILGNLALLQVQAISVSFVAACVSLLLGTILPRHSAKTIVAAVSNATTTNLEQGNSLRILLSSRPTPRPSGDSIRRTNFYTISMVAASAMSAASLSGFLLGSFMCTLTILCRIFGRDPDNIAPPIASCLGDLITLSLLGLVSNILIPFLDTPIPFIVFTLVTSIMVVCLYATRRNPHVADLLSLGWSPLFGAMVISSVTGIVLDLFASKYEGFALLAIVISGLPGAVGCIYVSRQSTALHTASLKCLPCLTPPASGRGAPHSSTGSSKLSPPPEMVSRLATITLLLVSLPIEIAFLSTLRALGWLHAPLIFLSFSVLFFCCAVLASILIARFLTSFLWKRGLDPDTYALPIHSAVMDLIGQILLVLCFKIVSLFTRGKALSRQ